MRRGLNRPSPQAMMDKGRVNLSGMSEVIWQPLYDYQTLLAAGANSQRFFIDPVGTNSKTKADTNMELAGQLPAGQRFSVTGIQFEIYPGVAINGTTASSYSDDVLDVLKGGYLEFTIGSKAYVTQGNLMKFPPVNRLGQDSSTTVTTDRYVYCAATGREFSIADLTLESSQNFNVTLHELAALPSGNNARIGVTLNGYLGRNAQ